MSKRTKGKQLSLFIKRMTGWALVFSLTLILCPARVRADEQGKELNIYAIYLDSEKKGDSVLLESRGEYLLIDMGRTEHVAAVIEQLKLLGVKRLDVMFSHLHIDHTGGSKTNPEDGLKQLTAAGISVNTLYLPSPILTVDSLTYLDIYSALQIYMDKTGGGQIEYLNVGSELYVGDARGTVIGPVETSQISPSTFQELEISERYVRYENNCSLVTMFYCGATRYLTAGDIYAEEADFLVKKYGDELHADIMKLSHHGTGSGNTAAFLACVRPKYSFAENTYFTDVSEKTGRWKTYTAVSRASKYGICYMVGNERQTMIYHIKSDVITLYQGKTLASGIKLTGWHTFFGSDGTVRDHEQYYFDEEGQPANGVLNIDGQDYFFLSGGRMEYGKFDTAGKYKGWMTYEEGRRYFTLSADKEYAYLTRGFARLKGGYYYFKPDGCVLTSELEDSKQIVQINSYRYCIDPMGEIWCDEWFKRDGCWYYFGKDGIMKQNQVCKVDGEYYIFTADGSIVTANAKLELHKFGSETYAVSRSGYLVRSQCCTINGAKYYMNAKGIVQKNKLVKINNKYYYFGKNGKLVTNKTVQISGKTYYCNKSGVANYVTG